MKVKKIIIFSALLGFIVGCGDSTSSSSFNNKIADEDKQLPTSINNDFVYDDLTGDSEVDEKKWYINDLKDVALPDPYVLTVQEDGKEVYYIYGTSDRTGSKRLDCYRTTDFNKFEAFLNIDQENPNSWSNCSDRSRFAPEVYYIDGTYYMYYSDIHKDTNLRYISVMTSDSPTGPFVEYNNGEDAVFRYNDEIGFSALDQHVFQDDDGTLYLYYSIYHTGVSQYIVGVKLNSPVEADWSTYKVLVRPGQPTPNIQLDTFTWETYTGFKVAEGPFMLKSPNGKYYLTYSVNHYPNRYYTVCYAVSDSPLGDYTKPYTKGGNWTNVLFGYAGSKLEDSKVYQQWSGFMSGTGHHCFFKSGNQYMIGYHAHKNREDSNSGRMFAMDYIFFDDEGTPFSRGPSYSMQPLPEAISGYKNIASLGKMKSEGINNPERLVDNFVVEHYNLEQEQDKEVTLSSGKSYLEFDFDKKYNIGGILIYNSAFYDKAMTDPISFINFGNGNVIIGGEFNIHYFNDEKEFINPCSAYTFDFEDINTNKIIIEFDNENECCLNEIVILGYENE